MQARHAVAAVALCAGLALAGFAWPRFVGGAVIAPYEDMLRSVARGARPDVRSIDAAREAAAVSQSWFAHGETMRRRGAFELVRASRAETAEGQRAALRRSIDWLRAGLARGPGDSFAWLQLAQATRVVRGAAAEVNPPLRMSLRTAPYEHRLIVPRLDVAFSSWPALAPDIREAMTFQIRRAVDTAPRALVRATRRNFALRQVRRAVADSPIHRERFNIVYLSPDR